MWKMCWVLIAAVVCAPLVCFAELDSASSEALEQTLKLLRSEQERSKAVLSSPDAVRADANAKSVAGSPENTNQLYEISAIVMSDLVKKTNGDIAALQSLMIEAGKDQEKFYKSLSPEAQQKIKQLAEKVEQKRQPSSPPALNAPD